MLWWWAIGNGSLPFYKKIIIFIFHKRYDFAVQTLQNK